MPNSVATLDPSSDVSHSGPSIIGIGATFAATVADGTGASGLIDFPALTSGSQNFILNIANTFSMPAASQLRGLQIKCNGEFVSPGTTPNVTHQLTATNSTVPNPFSPALPAIAFNTLYAQNPPGGLTTDSMNGPIWDCSALGITDLQWNGFTTNFVWTFTVLSPNAETKVTHQTSHVLQVYYNQAPTGTVNVGGSTGTFTIPTLTPTISWVYADPDGDLQERFRVTVYAGSTVTGSLIYDSGEQFGNQLSYTLPAGTLKNYVQYTIQVLVADQGSNGRYSVAASANRVTVTPQVDPILGPVFTPQLGTPPNFATWSYNKSNGSISNLRTMARVNMLSFTDANLETTAGAGSAGNWTVSAGASITLAPQTAGATAWHGLGWMKWTSAAAGPQTITLTSGAYSGFQPGQIVTAVVHLKCSARRVANLQIVFQNGLGSPPTAPGDINTGSWPISLAGYAAYVVQAVVPTGGNGTAITAQLVVNIQGVVNADTGNIDGASITHGVINLLDNSSFELGGVGGNIVPFWTILNPGGGVSSVVTGDTPGNTDLVSGNQSVELDSNSGFTQNLNLVMASGTPAANGNTAFIAPQGCDHMLSAYAKGQIMTGASAGQFVMNYGAGANTFTPTLGTWLRFSSLAVSSGFATTTDSTVTIGQKNVGTVSNVRYDDVSLERIWKFINGDFEIGSGNLTATQFLGLATALTTNVGWQEESPNAVSPSCSITNSDHNTGTQCLQMLQATAPATPTSAVASQFFTVSGASTVQVSYAWRPRVTANQTLNVLLTFYNSAGDTLINPANGLRVTTIQSVTTSAIAAFATFNGATITVPAEAAYAKLSYSMLITTTAWFNIDSVVVTLGATVGPCAVWQDGGWSTGGLYNTTTAAHNTVFLGVQQSADNVTYSRTVRAPGGFQTLTNPAVPGVVQAFTDYEWPPSLLDTPTTVNMFYRAQMQVTAFDGSQQNSFPSPYVPLVMYQFGSILTFYTDWWLIDPAIPADNLLLGVTKVSFSTTEDFGNLSGLGRAKKVVIGDTVQGSVISATLLSLSGQTYKALLNQIKKQTTLLLISPEGEQWYVRPIKRDWERVWTGSYFGNTRRIWTIQLQEVDPLP